MKRLLIAILLSLFIGEAEASQTSNLVLLPGDLKQSYSSREVKDLIKVELLVRVDENTYRHLLTLPREYSVNQALSAVYSVEHGFICFSEKDIRCINDVCGHLPDSYWSIKVNGNEQNYSSQSHLTEGDVLELTYVQSGEPTHVSLREWISSYKGK